MSEQIKRDVENIRRRVLGLPELAVPVEEVVETESAPKTSKPRTNKPRVARYDHALIKSLREQGQTVAQIAKEIGAHGNTVRNALRAMDLYEPDTRGQQPQTMCGAGLHKMSENSRTLKRGGRMCIPCQAERGREHYQKTNQNKKNRQNA